jgi:hypothetical protein
MQRPRVTMSVRIGETLVKHEGAASGEGLGGGTGADGTLLKSEDLRI